MRLRLFLIFVMFLLLVEPGWPKASRGYRIYGGIVYPHSWSKGYTFGAAIKLGEISESTFLFTNFNYWQANRKSADLLHENIALSIEVNYYISDFKESLYIGAGLSINIISWEILYTDYHSGSSEIKMEKIDNTLGFIPLVGYKINLNNVSPFVEMRYNFIEEFNTFQVVGGLNVKIN